MRPLLFAWAIAGADAALADSSNQVWPELDAYFRTSETTRVMLMAKSTREEGEADERQAGIHLDLTLAPMLRTDLAKGDWQRQRYLWMRVGYRYIASPGESGHENRGILELNGHTLPLWAGVDLAARLRWEARDDDGVHSDRYRVRLQAEKRIRADGHSLIPFVNAEAFYDTRYDSWNRQRYQAGVEIGLNPHWRLVPSLYHQVDSRSQAANVNAFGLVLKYFY